MRAGKQVELAQRRDGYILEKGERGTAIEIE